MKKFISMVMAAAMVVSLVPATAFAASDDVTASAKVVDVLELTEKQAKDAPFISEGNYEKEVPELQLKITNADYRKTNPNESTMDVTLKLDNAEFVGSDGETKLYEKTLKDMVTVLSDATGKEATYITVSVNMEDMEEDEVEFTFTGQFEEDDKIIFDMKSYLTKTKPGTEATVSVESDMVTVDDLVYAVVQDNVLELDVKDTVDVAEEEIVELEKVTIEAATGYLPTGDTDKEDIKVKLNSGFEFVDNSKKAVNDVQIAIKDDVAKVTEIDGDTMWLEVVGSNVEKIVITGILVEADTAKEGDVATLTVSATEWDKASIEVAKVVGEGLTISVDEDADVPEIWSGVDVNNTGLTADDDHMALEFTVEETVAGAYSEKEEVEFVLPAGVYVTDVNVSKENGDADKDKEWDKAAFEAAYNEGDYTSFVFKKRTIGETTAKPHEIEVELELVADPGFVGDVKVEMLVDGESVGEVTIATFKTPLVVEAQANDLIIDYRNTEVPTDIVVKEAEAGLWKDGTVVGFALDKNIEFEGDATFEVNAESDMEVKDSTKAGVLKFEVTEESDDEAAVVTISDIALYMQRSLPAGAYDLEMVENTAVKAYNAQPIFAPELKTADAKGCTCTTAKALENSKNWADAFAKHAADVCSDDYVVFVGDVTEYANGDRTDYSAVVKEGFVNIVTAGRDADDASFTTKVVVPVGESYIVAGEQQVALDVPAYVSAAGYTMLPVRAVAVALGILNNNVLWDQATKTVTILYGQRIITMQVGAKVVYVNGSAIPASASPEVVDGRTFLPMRDLATALGVTDITWDAATKTATLNGNK